MRGFLSKKIGFIVFFVLWISLFTIMMIIGNVQEYYDDAVYWSLGEAYNWHSTNLAWGFRGYLLPLIFSLAKKAEVILGGDMYGYRILSSFVFAILHTYVFKEISKLVIGDEVEENQVRLYFAGGISGILSFVFFRGLYIYALSDIYAFTFLLLAIIVESKLIKSDSMYVAKRIVLSLVLGFLLYGMYNIRTIYLFVSVALFITLIICCLRKNMLKNIYSVPLSFVGSYLGAIPMIRLNEKLLGTKSWLVPTDGLMLFQLQTGITTNRYATFVGDSSEFTAAGMFYYDSIGQHILEMEQIETVSSISQLVKLFFKYPLDFIGMYTRHFLNILYPIYPNQYIKSIRSDKSALLFLFFAILVLFVAFLVNFYKPNKKNIAWLSCILFPCLCILPGAVEIRFFVGLYYIMFMFVTLGFSKLWELLKNNKGKFILIFVLGLMIYLAYGGYLLSMTNAGMATFN